MPLDKSFLDSPLHILVGADVPPNPDSGAAGTVFQMNAALRRLGHVVDEFWENDLGRSIRHGNLHYLFELPRKYCTVLRKRLAQRDYDVIELNQPHAYSAAANLRQRVWPGVFVNRSHGHEVRSEEALEPWRERLGIKRPGFFRGAASRVIRKLLDRQWELITRTADGFVVSCEEDADFLNARYEVPREQIGVITQGVPHTYLHSPAPPVEDGRLQRLLYIGQLAFVKAPMILGRAVSLILRRALNATMTWVCSRAHHAEALSLVDEDVRRRVTLLDWMPQEQLINVIDQHGVFLFPSFFEGFGKAPLEAMARGLCVVASRTGGMRDYIRDGENGVLVPIGDSERMANAALSLMEDADRAKRISLAARATAAEHTWDRCARDAEVFYRRLIDLKRRRHCVR